MFDIFGLFKKGMEAGAKPFEEKNKQMSQDIKKDVNDIKKDVSDLKDGVYDIIDLMEMDESEKKIYFEKLKKNKKTKLRKFSIKIIYDRDKKFAEEIREILSGQSNIHCYISDLKKHCSEYDEVPNYYIFLGDLDCLLKNTKETFLIYSAFGCNIWRVKNNIIVQFEKYDMEKHRTEFIEYCKMVVKKINDENNGLRTVAGYDNKKQGYTKSTSEKVKNMSENIKDGFFMSNNTVVQGLYKIGTFPVTMCMDLLGNVISIGETALNETIEKLENKIFDENLAKEAQKEIVGIKIAEYIYYEQIRINCEYED